MYNLMNQLESTIALLKKNVTFSLYLIACLFGIHLVNWLIGYRLNLLGIYPRRWFGLIGIGCSPFLHSNFNHLFFNSIPLFVLINFVLLNGFPTFYCVSFTIILLSGFTTWLLARSGFHIGASDVVMGYWSYLLLNAYEHTTIMSIVLALLSLYYFGGLITNLFPTEMRSSWESHIFGFLAGLAAAYVCPLGYVKYLKPILVTMHAWL